MHSLSLVVATKDRASDLNRLLDNLRQQVCRPDEIIIVDASQEPVEMRASLYPELRVRYLRHSPPSAAAQRNVGIRACSRSATLIGLIDDDTTFEPGAFERMRQFWETAEPAVLGAAFNIRNYPTRGRQRVKHSRLVNYFGLYSRKPGSVSLSGWQTIIPELSHTQFVEWLPSTAVIWRRKVFEAQLFDEFFEGYSYLEDLDFSYAVGKQGRLAVVGDAGFLHFPSSAGRVSARHFGRVEARNRLYFVRKHQLSLLRCYINLAIRISMSCIGGIVNHDRRLIARALGNCEALILPWSISN